MDCLTYAATEVKFKENNRNVEYCLRRPRSFKTDEKKKISVYRVMHKCCLLLVLWSINNSASSFFFFLSLFFSFTSSASTLRQYIEYFKSSCTHVVCSSPWCHCAGYVCPQFPLFVPTEKSSDFKNFCKILLAMSWSSSYSKICFSIFLSAKASRFPP